MADGAGQADIRGIDIQKFLTGFADEDTILKGLCRTAPTSAREIRWYQKTAGFVQPVTTTAITGNLLANTAPKALAPITRQTVTRNTSYIRKYYTVSETISSEDEKDNDVDILMTMVRDLLKGVASQIDTRIYNVGTESLSPVNINTAAATGTGWDDTTNGNPLLDIMVGMQKIRSNRYNPLGGVLYINSIEHKNLLNYLITVKGSSIPAFSSQKVVEGKVMEILGLNVIVSENATTDYAWIFIPQTTLAWKNFTSLTSEVERLPGIGKRIHVWEEGEALLENPKSSHLITDTVT